ncbi:site-specific integrase [Streptacidiphilus neutrinimicus]|uniref:site-specific integrase n=1 Tax=Streptacidiphilus neutrinimicus TaxID=105420 RepID=UPI001F38A3C0|nr:site-specific integrase [Streptacidiphilus neutrinimicus]
MSEAAVRDLLKRAAADTGITDASGQPLLFAPHDLRRIFVTDAVMNGMPPHIAQLVRGHKDINTTMGYKAVYPEEVITGHRAFIARRRGLGPTGESRMPTEEEMGGVPRALRVPEGRTRHLRESIQHPLHPRALVLIRTSRHTPAATR